jgi:hypothetical protein
MLQRKPLQPQAFRVVAPILPLPGMETTKSAPRVAGWTAWEVVACLEQYWFTGAAATRCVLKLAGVVHRRAAAFGYSQLTCIMFCYICYTIQDFSPTRPKVAPLSQSDRRIIAPLLHLF